MEYIERDSGVLGLHFTSISRIINRRSKMLTNRPDPNSARSWRYEAIASFPIPSKCCREQNSLKRANPSEVKGDSFFGKMLASDEKVLKVLE
jgi:hypothetical protein